MMLRQMLKTAGAATVVGAACVAYGTLIEVRSFRLRRVTTAVLPTGAQPIRVLHLSDIHLLPHQRAKQRWLAGLAALEPDLVVNTGDNLAHADAVPYLISSLGRLLERPGVHVYGSNDYYEPKLKNPFVYFRARGVPKTPDIQLPWREMTDRFARRAWRGISHQRTVFEINGLQLELRGTDDAHLGLDDYTEVAGPRADGIDVAIGVTHAPYLRILDAMAADGMDLIMAGHTHGGQVCLPYYGALVTNCDLDTHRVRGLSEHHGVPLHVSAGLGTSPYAPFRFACPPEATLLTLVPKH